MQWLIQLYGHVVLFPELDCKVFTSAAEEDNEKKFGLVEEIDIIIGIRTQKNERMPANTVNYENHEQ